jgi:hypothetical protein
MNKIFNAIKYFSITVFLLVTIFLIYTGDAQGLSTYRVAPVKNGGTIEGTVIYTGKEIPKTELFFTKDAAHCGRTSGAARLKVNENGGVKNAIVYLRNITNGKGFTRTETPILDQSECDFLPRIMIVPVNSELIIKNSDTVLHNVHAYTPGEERRTLFNIAQPVKGQRTTIRNTHFSEPGLIMATCDAGHPWMNAYIMVAEHPYYTMTDENGAFRLEDVPAGTYELVVWHEGVHIVNKQIHDGIVQEYVFEEPYEFTQPVTVQSDDVVKTGIEFSLR